MTTNVDKQLTALELARPYAELAMELAKGFKKVKGLQDSLTTAKGGLWGGFKQALSLGMSAGHNASNVKAGLAVACEEAKIPSGSYRGYVGTIGHMFNELADGTLTLAEAEQLSIGDARKRYRKPASTPAEVSAESAAPAANVSEATNTAAPITNAMLASVMDKVKDWDDASLSVLLSIIDDLQEQASQEEAEELEEAA